MGVLTKAPITKRIAAAGMTVIGIEFAFESRSSIHQYTSRQK